MRVCKSVHFAIPVLQNARHLPLHEPFMSESSHNQTRFWPRVLVLTCALLVVLVAQFLVINHVIDRDRVALQRSFADDRLRQLDRALASTEAELETISDDLDAARHFLADSPILGRGEMGLAAMLLLRPSHYRGLSIVRANGDTEFQLFDSPEALDDRNKFRELIESTGQRAAESPESKVAISSRFQPHGEEGPLLRAFAKRLSSHGSDDARAVVLLVDVSPILAPLRVLSGDEQTSLLVLDGKGTEPITSTSLEKLIESKPSRLEPLLETMRSDPSGTQRFSMQSEPATADAIAAYGIIGIDDTVIWRVATITSMDVLEGRQEKTSFRLHLISGVVASLIVAFGAHFLLASRREYRLSERLEVAREVAHLHERANKILSSIPSGVMLLSEEGIVTQYNDTIADWRPAATADESLSDFFADADLVDRGKLEKIFEDTLTDGKTRVQLHDSSTLFGEPRHLRVTVVPISSDAPEEQAAMIFDDLSELHALQSHLLRAEKLATVGILSAGIAHEIGTPLGVIRGSSELLLTTTEQSESGIDTLELIISQIDRISEVISGVLNFSRDRPPHAAPTPLRAVVDDVLKLLRFEQKRKSVDVDVSIPDDLPDLRANPQHLQQVLINLLVNAFDASTGSDAPVSLRARIDDDGDNPRNVEIRVEDQGHGIPEDRIHQIFDPFFTTKKRGQGTGLGLPIVANIIESHEGQIDVRSRVGVGTTFIITWPAYLTLAEDSTE